MSKLYHSSKPDHWTVPRNKHGRHDIYGKLRPMDYGDGRRNSHFFTNTNTNTKLTLIGLAIGILMWSCS